MSRENRIYSLAAILLALLGVIIAYWQLVLPDKPPQPVAGISNSDFSGNGYVVQGSNGSVTKNTYTAEGDNSSIYSNVTGNMVINQ